MRADPLSDRFGIKGNPLHQISGAIKPSAALRASDATRDTLDAATTPEQFAIPAFGSSEFQRR